eukprot:snap_masked-scaffold_3-processed-gene-8.40-mRNA-1 protein AED:1.00 eAED:1.00 QI:0/-1/0/0/-1/1/1/0/122
MQNLTEMNENSMEFILSEILIASPEELYNMLLVLYSGIKHFSTEVDTVTQGVIKLNQEYIKGINRPKNPSRIEFEILEHSRNMAENFLKEKTKELEAKIKFFKQAMTAIIYNRLVAMENTST